MKATLNSPILERSFKRGALTDGDRQCYIVTVETPEGNQSVIAVGITKVLAIVQHLLSSMDPDLQSSIKISFEDSSEELDQDDPSPLNSALRAEILEVARG